MLSKEEEQTILYLKDCITKHNLFDEDFALYNIEILINLITKLQKEHVHYKECQRCGKEFRAKRNDTKYCDECKKKINKEWYKNLTEEQKERRREQAKICMRKIRERRKHYDR